MTTCAVAQISKSARLRRAPGAGEALVEPLVVHVRQPRRVEDRQPAVADLGGQRDVLGPLGAEHDRDVGAQRMHDRLERLAQPGGALTGQRQRVVRAGAGDRRLAGPHLTDDVDVLAGARQRLGEPLPVPALDHLRAGDAETEDVPAAGEVVQGQRRHRAGGRRARRQLHHRGAQPHPGRLAAPPRQWGERVRPPRLGGEHRVEARLLGGGHQLGVVGRRLGAPVSELQTELHATPPSVPSGGHLPILATILRTCSTRCCERQPEHLPRCTGPHRFPRTATFGAADTVLRLHPFGRTDAERSSSPRCAAGASSVFAAPTAGSMCPSSSTTRSPTHH